MLNSVHYGLYPEQSKSFSSGLCLHVLDYHIFTMRHKEEAEVNKFSDNNSTTHCSITLTHSLK